MGLFWLEKRKGFSQMKHCAWCDKSLQLIAGKQTVMQNDLRFAPVFILDEKNEHLPEPGIGDPELRKATTLRRWVHDLRWYNGTIVQCDIGDARDEMIINMLTLNND